MLHTSTINWVTLKDGSEIPQDAFLRFKNNIEIVAERHFEAFQELVLNCRDPQYILLSYQPSLDILKKADLINRHGEVYDVAKRVVLNSAEGKFPDIRLVDPLKKV